MILENYQVCVWYCSQEKCLKKTLEGWFHLDILQKKTSYECFYSNAEDKPSNSKEEVFHPYILTIFLYSRMVIEFSDLYAGNHKNAW